VPLILKGGLAVRKKTRKTCKKSRRNGTGRWNSLTLTRGKRGAITLRKFKPAGQFQGKKPRICNRVEISHIRGEEIQFFRFSQRTGKKKGDTSLLSRGGEKLILTLKNDRGSSGLGET